MVMVFFRLIGCISSSSRLVTIFVYCGIIYYHCRIRVEQSGVRSPTSAQCGCVLHRRGQVSGRLFRTRHIVTILFGRFYGYYLRVVIGRWCFLPICLTRGRDRIGDYYALSCSTFWVCCYYYSRLFCLAFLLFRFPHYWTRVFSRWSAVTIWWAFYSSFYTMCLCYGFLPYGLSIVFFRWCWGVIQLVSSIFRCRMYEMEHFRLCDYILVTFLVVFLTCLSFIQLGV